MLLRKTRRCSRYGSGGAFLYVLTRNGTKPPIFAPLPTSILMLTSLRIQNFRSIRDGSVKLGQVNLLAVVY